MKNNITDTFDAYDLPALSQRAASIVSSRGQWRLYKATLLVLDWIMIILAFKLAFYIRFDLNLPIFQQDFPPRVYFYENVMLLLSPLWLLVFASHGLYNRKYLLGGVEEYSRVFRGTVSGLLIVIVAGFLEPGFIIARGWLLIAWFNTFFIVGISRFWLRRVIYYLRRHGFFLSPTIIVGANDEGISLARQLLAGRTSGLDLIGFADKKFPVGKIVCENLRVLCKMENLDKAIKHYGVEDLILATSAISSHDNALDIFKKYGVTSDVTVRLSSGLYEIITTGLTVQELAYVPLVTVNKVRLTGFDKVLKVLLDYLITIPVIILISPILLFIAILVKIDSPGPVLHRRKVMGVNNSQFYAFKFRTMYIDGDKILEAYPELLVELQSTHKLKEDPRITRIGKYLRKYSVDELLQLLNVIRGEMSLVGPRMISPEEMKNYNQWGINLLTVRPGITGLWQVSGRSDVSYADRIRLDMHYIRNWSIWLDLQLLLRTVPVVLRGKGAY
jgi:exopolysaccharide biosynthesis polyprenyl glycosylphosphotransferase